MAPQAKSSRLLGDRFSDSIYRKRNRKNATYCMQELNNCCTPSRNKSVAYENKEIVAVSKLQLNTVEIPGGPAFMGTSNPILKAAIGAFSVCISNNLVDQSLGLEQIA